MDRKQQNNHYQGLWSLIMVAMNDVCYTYFKSLCLCCLCNMINLVALTGKMRDPEWNRMETPHSCGEVCKKNRSANCKHHCNMYVWMIELSHKISSRWFLFNVTWSEVMVELLILKLIDVLTYWLCIISKLANWLGMIIFHNSIDKFCCKVKLLLQKFIIKKWLLNSHSNQADLTSVGL